MLSPTGADHCLPRSTSYPAELTKRWTLRLKGQLKPRAYDSQFEFGLISAGRAKVSGSRCLWMNGDVTPKRALP